MKKQHIFGLIGIGLVLSACQATVKSPDVELEGPSGTKVTIGGDDHDGNGKFCPPGQAKKNNC